MEWIKIDKVTEKVRLSDFDRVLVTNNHERLFRLLPFVMLLELIMTGVSFYIQDVVSIRWIHATIFAYTAFMYFLMTITRAMINTDLWTVRVQKSVQIMTSVGFLIWGASMLGYKPQSVISYFDLLIVLVLTGLVIQQSTLNWICYYTMVLIYLMRFTPFIKLMGAEVTLSCISMILFFMTALYINHILYTQERTNYLMKNELLRQKNDLEILVDEKTRELLETEQFMMKEVALLLTLVIEHYDEYTKGHSESVAQISEALGRAYGLDLKSQKEVYWAGLIHDIGKIEIDKTLLNKVDPLTENEFEMIKAHSEYGYELTRNAATLKRIAIIIRAHHERYDGKGYPDGLKGDEIPIEAQIIAVADAWDVMRSDRVYKKALSIENSRLELIKNSGKQFSPTLVALFLDLEIASVE